MSKIGGEVRQQSLHVLALAVPSDKPDDGEGVAEVVQSRLISRFPRAMNAGFFAEPLIDQFSCVAGDAFVLDRPEQWGGSGAASRRPLLTGLAKTPSGRKRDLAFGKGNSFGGEFRLKRRLCLAKIPPGHIKGIMLGLGDSFERDFARWESAFLCCGPTRFR